ncbi:MAG: Gfo/Idh/MocA family oxidoreductase [Alphaproteobacteria bacterium]|nr:Gfo/Idh/MocA family oxidoreductase [Alphaproteobacteria bacterium]
MINAAIVGFGWWGQTHARAIAGSGKIRVVKIVDAFPDKVREAAKSFGLKVTDSYDEVLADKSVDAVVLVTPHSQHTPQILAAAKAGKHVLTEKPFALSKADAEKSVAAARTAGVQLGLGHNSRHSSVIQAMKKLIDCGELGHIVHAEFNMSHDVLVPVEGWRKSAEEAPAAGIYHMGIHTIDNFQYMLGRMTEAFGQTATVGMTNDSALAVLRFANGATGYICNVTNTPMTVHMHIIGTKGWVRRAGPDQILVAFKGRSPELRDLVPMTQEEQVRRNDDNFAAACEGKETYLITPEQMIHGVAVLETITASIKSRRPLPVPQ